MLEAERIAKDSSAKETMTLTNDLLILKAEKKSTAKYTTSFEKVYKPCPFAISDGHFLFFVIHI